MDKNTLTGFILIAAVLIGFSYFSRPDEAEIQAQLKQDSIANVERQKADNGEKFSLKNSGCRIENVFV